ncbi:hypothetical protein IJ596_02570 [bacterium]|nr:hypothetical protein [bacterium]
MFSSIKDLIKQLANNAVIVAETELGSGRGEEKKKKAIKYILDNLPFCGIVKEIISIFLSGFIDNAIEAAVYYMNSLQKEEKGE